MSKQKLDEADNTLQEGQGQSRAIRAAVSKTKRARRIEERAIADAKVFLASATTADIEAQLAKIRITSPIDGIVGLLVASPGEVISPGETILTLTLRMNAGFRSRFARIGSAKLPSAHP